MGFNFMLKGGYKSSIISLSFRIQLEDLFPNEYCLNVFSPDSGAYFNYSNQNGGAADWNVTGLMGFILLQMGS
jgi:hypothetical protein